MCGVSRSRRASWPAGRSAAGRSRAMLDSVGRNGSRGSAAVAVIEVDGLIKRYGRQVAVDGVSFAVEEGEIFGILGPNGAGKTTAVECVEGLRRADAGTVRVLGLDSRADGPEVRQLI